MEPERITERSILLQKYLDHNGELELQALYALQALVHKLDHPAGTYELLKFSLDFMEVDVNVTVLEVAIKYLWITKYDIYCEKLHGIVMSV